MGEIKYVGGNVDEPALVLTDADADGNVRIVKLGTPETVAAASVADAQTEHGDPVVRSASEQTAAAAAADPRDAEIAQLRADLAAAQAGAATSDPQGPPAGAL